MCFVPPTETRPLGEAADFAQVPVGGRNVRSPKSIRYSVFFSPRGDDDDEVERVLFFYPRGDDDDEVEHINTHTYLNEK